MLGTTGTSAAQVTLASTLARLVPALLLVLRSDDNELQERLQECARRAEHQVNAPLFGNRDPTRAECGGKVYEQALGGETLMLTPKGIFGQ